MVLGLHPGVLFAIAIGLFLVTHIWWKWPLPAAFITVSALTALLADYGVPFRHLVEGGFGFINLVLALFAGAFFGHMMRASGAAEAAAEGIVRAFGGRVLPVLAVVSLPLLLVGMFVGIAGVAVLSAGVFAVPALRRIGFDDPTIAAFIAVLATAGMMAPPTNVPAMFIANGVNMPWTNTATALAAIAIPFALASLAWFTWGSGPTKPVERPQAQVDWAMCLGGLAPILVMLVIWVSVRLFPATLVDPASALILVIGGLVVVPRMGGAALRNVVMSTFSGTPLLLGAVLVTVGILVQIMTLTGVRGWLVINVVSLVPPWNFPSLIIGMPLIGGTLTAMSVSDVIGVPFAFSFIGQDMILNVAGLAAIASLSEFVPPTSIAAALACYVVGGPTVGQVFRRSWAPMVVLAALGVLMLLLAPRLQGILT